MSFLKVVEENGREIVDHPGSVAVVAIDEEQRLWLVRQWRQPARTELLELPAGTREEGESPLETAQRELEEECGLVGGEWRELGRFWTSPGFVREEMTLYLAAGVAPGGRRASDEDEDVSVVRWAADEIERRLGEVEDLKTLAALLLYLQSTR
jgi:ADP-ribose pyrophosphatase